MIDQRELFAEPSKPHDHGCKVSLKIPAHWTVAADFDGPNQCYRYTLVHRWAAGPMALIAMKNPSAADIRVGDQTVMKTARIFRRLGFGAQVVVNSCAYRHVTPAKLREIEDPVGPRNLTAIANAAADADLVVVAHGLLPGALQKHADAMCETLLNAGHNLHVLRLTAGGVPMHPLYIPNDTDPVVWRRLHERRIPCRRT